jgi:hypothetical protein
MQRIYKRDDINLQTFDGSLTPQPVSIAVQIVPSSEGMSSPMLLMYLSTPPAENVTPSRKIKLLTMELNPFLYCLFNS